MRIAANFLELRRDAASADWMAVGDADRDDRVLYGADGARNSDDTDVAGKRVDAENRDDPGIVGVSLWLTAGLVAVGLASMQMMDGPVFDGASAREYAVSVWEMVPVFADRR